MSNLLSVRDLRVGFGKGAAESPVVKGVSFALKAGETLAIVGESGSGKSVTALSINRLVDFGGGRLVGGQILGLLDLAEEIVDGKVGFARAGGFVGHEEQSFTPARSPFSCIAILDPA